MRHPGYLIETQNELAMRYNDRSVLESHHCAVTFHIMQVLPRGGTPQGPRGATAAPVPHGV